MKRLDENQLEIWLASACNNCFSRVGEGPLDVSGIWEARGRIRRPLLIFGVDLEGGGDIFDYLGVYS